MKKSLILIFLIVIASFVFGQQKMALKKPINIDNTQSYAGKWQFLKTALDTKRIVALGESLHGVKEYNQSKLEIIKFLHEEMGFNVLAIESDLAMNYYGNLYRNQVSDTLLLKETFTAVWHTETHLELIKYLQTHPKLKIIGFDVTNSHSLNNGLRRLGIVDSLNIEVLEKQYQNFAATYKSELYFNNISRDSVMTMNFRMDN